MEKTIFKDRVGQYPNRKKITILEQHANEIIANVELNDVPLTGNEGTPINADVMNKFQDEIIRAGENSDTALNKSTTALSNSETALTKSESALEASRTAETNALYAKNRSDEVYTALANRGTTVMVNATSVTTISFDSDPQTQINSKVANSDLFNLVYPVGSIYMSVAGTNPGILFGGTWEQLQDRFLLGAGSTYSNGATGGSKDAVAVSHNHTITQNVGGTIGYGNWGVIYGNGYEGAPGDVSGNITLESNYNSGIGNWADGGNNQRGRNVYAKYRIPDVAIASAGSSGIDKNMPP